MAVDIFEPRIMTQMIEAGQLSETFTGNTRHSGKSQRKSILT